MNKNKTPAICRLHRLTRLSEVDDSCSEDGDGEENNTLSWVFSDVLMGHLCTILNPGLSVIPLWSFQGLSHI